MIRNANDIGLLILRIGFGGMMLFAHGWSKWQKLIGPGPIEFSDPLGVGAQTSLAMAVFAEVICAFLVLIGWYTRWALVPLIFTMLVAVFLIHLDDPFSKMEKGLLFLGAYLALFFAGPGWYSIDEYFKK